MLKKFCLIGASPEHSLSPQIHNLFASQFNIDLQYSLVALKKIQVIDFIEDFFAHGGTGINVTSPYKELVGQYLNAADGVVNTIYKVDSKLYGANTDIVGLQHDLIANNICIQNKKLLILGAGGVVRAVLPHLLNANPKEIYIANRTLAKVKQLQHYYATEKIHACELTQINNIYPDLIINAITPNNLEHVYNIINFTNTIAYDINYSNKDFLQTAITKGAYKTINGLGMLIVQAASSFELWLGKKPDHCKVVMYFQAQNLP